MLEFRAWLVEAGMEVGIVYNNPTNDDRYAEKGVKSKWEGDKPPAMPGYVDPDAMYLGTGKRSKKRRGKARQTD